LKQSATCTCTPRTQTGKSGTAEIAEEAIAAGLDFIIVTDHNVWVNGVEGWYENENGRVLLLTGEEVHNVRRQPQASHLLVYGAEKELAPYAHDPQQLIDEATAAGGYTFWPTRLSGNCVSCPTAIWAGTIGPLKTSPAWKSGTICPAWQASVADKLDRLPVAIDVIDKLYAVWLSGRPEQSCSA
jgi:hypothetical protein